MMKGVASSRGAITIMNAIPTGIGAALGISLQTDAEVVLSKGSGRVEASLPEGDEETLLVEECIRGVCERFGMDLHDAKVRTASSIPISRGLKSSSAAANAVTLAAIRALGKGLDDVEVVKLGVEAAKRAKVTVTGAFDDAMACYFGGIAVTDNQGMRVLKHSVLKQGGIRIILHVPGRKIRKQGISRDTFSRERNGFKDIEKLVMDGKYFEALTLNGKLVASCLNIENAVADVALRNGALAAGITGTGPATAIVCRESDFDKLIDCLPREGAVLISAHLNETPAPEVRARL